MFGATWTAGRSTPARRLLRRAGHPIGAQPPDPRGSWRSHAVVVAVLGGLFGVTSYALYMGKNADLARQKTADLEKADAADAEADRRLRQLRGRDERNGRPDDALKHLVEALALIKAEAGDRRR